MMEDFCLQKRVFFVGDIPENFDLNAPPMTGIEYLYKVRLETELCPRVVVADIDTAQYQSRQTVVMHDGNGFIRARPGFEPEVAWEREQLDIFQENQANFIESRALLKSTHPRRDFPKHRNSREWCLYCLGGEAYDKIYRSQSTHHQSQPSHHRSQSPANRPLLSVMLYLDQRSVGAVLSYHVSWLQSVGFSHEQGEWIYALLLCLEKPLDPDTCALLRNLSRVCSKLRSELESLQDEFLQPLNLVMCIVAQHFDQKDMCDSFFNNI